MKKLDNSNHSPELESSEQGLSPETSSTPEHKRTSVGTENIPYHVAFIITGIILVVLGQLLRSKSYTERIALIPILLTFSGIIIFLWGLRKRIVAPVSEKMRALVVWYYLYFRKEPHPTILILLSASCLIVVFLSTGVGPKIKDPLVVISAWILAICYVFLSNWKPGWRFPKNPWQVLAWAMGLFFLALILRAVDTAHFPVQLSGDEASIGLAAQGFLRGDWNNIFNVNWYSFPSLFFLLPAASINILGNTTEALRIPAALGGSLTVAAVYLLGRQLFNHRTGLFAALLLAGSHFHIHFSRLGLNNIWDGLFFVLVPLTFWSGWKTGRRSLFLLSGLLLGLSQYFYVTTRLLPVLVLLWIAIFGWREPSTFKRLRGNLLLMFWMFIVVFGPLAWFYLRQPDEYMAPLRRVSLFHNIEFLQLGFTGWVAFLTNLISKIINAFRGFTDLETHAWYTPGAPMLRPFYAAFFLLGIVLLLRQWKDNRTWLLMSWVAMIGMVGAFSESTPAAQRYIAGAPVAVLIAGYGFAEIADILGKFWPDRQRWVYFGFLTLVLISAFSDVYFYFKVYTPKSLMLDQNTRTIQKLADYLHAKQGNWQVLFYGKPGLGYHSINTVAFLEPLIVGVDATHPWGSPENPKPISKNIIFIFLPGHNNDLSGAMRDYPGGKKLDIVDPNMGQLFTIYELSHFQQSP